MTKSPKKEDYRGAHTILYLATNPERLGPLARAFVGVSENTLLASTESQWEMAIKIRIGKLVLPLK